MHGGATLASAWAGALRREGVPHAWGGDTGIGMGWGAEEGKQGRACTVARHSHGGGVASSQKTTYTIC